MNNIKFSIIMPCYNSELFLGNAVESIISQDYSNWELIAVNDGSNDKTLELLNNYARIENRIRVISKKNGGYSTAINEGLNCVTGDYFLMIGSDDMLFPQLFRRIVEEIEDSLPDMIAFRTVQFVGKDYLGPDSTTNYSNKTCLFETSIKEYISQFPNQSKILFTRDTSKCYKTSLLDDLRLFGKSGYDADGIFASLFAHRSKSFMSIPIDGYHWTLRPESVSATTNLSKNLDRLNNWRCFFEQISTLPIERSTDFDKMYARHYYSVAHQTVKMIKITDKSSVEEYKKSARAIPYVLKRYGIKYGVKKSIIVFLMTKCPRCLLLYYMIRYRTRSE